VRYQSTTGLDSDQIDELVGRIEEIECGWNRDMDGRLWWICMGRW